VRSFVDIDHRDDAIVDIGDVPKAKSDSVARESLRTNRASFSTCRTVIMIDDSQSAIRDRA